jgi:hypothetical protein
VLFEGRTLFVREDERLPNSFEFDDDVVVLTHA